MATIKVAHSLVPSETKPLLPMRVAVHKFVVIPDVKTGIRGSRVIAIINIGAANFVRPCCCAKKCDHIAILRTNVYDPFGIARV